MMVLTTTVALCATKLLNELALCACLFKVALGTRRVVGVARVQKATFRRIGHWSSFAGAMQHATIENRRMLCLA
jgi:hypothetical protein